MSDARQPSYLVGLIGEGIQASRSPALHEREADAQGIRYLYRLIDLRRLGVGVEALPALLESAERMGFDGLNITHPCKQAVIPLLDELSEVARAIGAVNTVRLAGGRRIGHNTDAAGFAESFRQGLPGAEIDRVVQLGAGGAGAATASALLSLGAGHLSLADIVPARAVALADRLGARFGAGRVSVAGELGVAMREAQGLVHATPVGMAAHPGLPLAPELLRPSLWVAESVYFPLETELLRVARDRGCRTLEGGGMAVFQAALAFEIFTGRAADPGRMLRHFASMGPG